MSSINAATDAGNREEVEKMLMYMSLYQRGFGCPDPLFFDGAMPAWPSMFDHVVSLIGKSHRAFDVAASRLPRIEGAFITKGPDGGTDLIASRPLSITDKERLFSSVGPGGFKAPPWLDATSYHPGLLQRVIQTRYVMIDVDGVGHQAGIGYSIESERGWANLINGPPIGPDRKPLAELGWNIGVVLATAAIKSWYVTIRFAPDAPGLRLITDPTGIRDFFRFRDIPDGHKRRAALANWVGQHWRATRDDPEAEVFVREHLRGTRTFSWHGLGVDIHITDADLARAEEARVRRKRMPAAEAIRQARRRP